MLSVYVDIEEVYVYVHFLRVFYMFNVIPHYSQYKNEICFFHCSFIFLLGSYLIPVMMTFVFLGSLGVATHNFVYDRENGQEEVID